MKVIDLLNKIANGEETPKEIRYEGTRYYYCEEDDLYKSYGIYKEFPSIYLKELNDEVEIIEEEKKIPEKLSTWFSVETKQSKELNIEYANTNFENMYEKINEIIDYLKSKGDE